MECRRKVTTLSSTKGVAPPVMAVRISTTVVQATLARCIANGRV